jgi:DNA-binding transcriptional LysR family regulator
MYLRQHRGVPLNAHPASAPGSAMPDWENVRTFLEVAQCGSFRSAACNLGQSMNALRRRINELEAQLGVTLFTRHVDGLRVTSEGQQILAAAQRMEGAYFDLVRARQRAVPSLAGEIRLAVTEGLGTFWLAPRLPEFQRAYPMLLVDLHCGMRSVDLLRLEADVAVQLTKPTAADLKMIRLARLHSMPFAAPSYIQTYGIPASVDELKTRHRIVFQFSEQSGGSEFYKRWFGDVPQPGFLAIRTNSSSAHAAAIANGAGIGWLVTYGVALGTKMVPIDLELRSSCDVWLTYHADAGRIPRVRHLIDWLVACFEPKQFPWFRDEFIHPREFAKLYRGGPLPSHFEGFGVAIAPEANPVARPSGAAAPPQDADPSGTRTPSKRD